MILKIDTTDTNQIKVALINPKTKKSKSLTSTQFKGSQVLMPMIVKILKENKINFSTLTEIRVNAGPGSFTGTRLGVSVANTLGYALNLPVNGKKGKIVLPKYAKSKFDK